MVIQHSTRWNGRWSPPPGRGMPFRRWKRTICSSFPLQTAGQAGTMCFSATLRSTSACERAQWKTWSAWRRKLKSTLPSQFRWASRQWNTAWTSWATPLAWKTALLCISTAHGSITWTVRRLLTVSMRPRGSRQVSWKCPAWMRAITSLSHMTTLPRRTSAPSPTGFTAAASFL